ncbi:MAG: hypothetical protein Q4A97_06660 [Comamonadaceae bacterium]|nr:hypothetical protein [Comamonadaceae bacterium]
MASTDVTPFNAAETVVEPKTGDQSHDQLWEQFLACEPLLNRNDEVFVEERIQTSDYCRRVVLSSMKFGGAELLEKARDDEGARALSLSIATGEYWLTETKALMEIMEAQILRLRMSLFEHKDMEELISKAQAELFE